MDNFRYRGVCCPICNKLFEESDDIVVCPECGTPYHRECYKTKGECLLKERHGTGYEFTLPTEENPDTNTMLCHTCGSIIAKSSKFCPNCGTQLDTDSSENDNINSTQHFQQSFQQPVNTFPQFNFDPLGGVDKSEKYDGVGAEEVASFVHISTPYYSRVFNNISKTGSSRFNFAAFLLSGAWFLYRKMYKIGTILLIVMLGLTIAGIYIEYNISLPMLKSVFASAGLDYNSASLDLSYMQKLMIPLQTMAAIDRLKIMLPTLISGLKLIVMIFCGIKANRCYMKHCITKIKQIKSTGTEQSQKNLIAESGGVNRGLAMSVLASYIIIKNLLPYLFLR